MSEDNMKDTELEQAAADETSTPAETSPSKKAAKPKRRKSTPASHPPCIDMIIEAISNLGEKNGSSFQAIKKYIATNFDCDMTANLMSHVRKALKSGVASGKLVQTKGKGASGSFKMGNVAPTLMSKPTKRQIASAEAAARNAAKAQKAAKKAAKAAKRPKKKKKPVVQKAAAAARRPTVKKSVKKPAAKKAAKSKKAAKRGRKGKK